MLTGCNAVVALTVSEENGRQLLAWEEVINEAQEQRHILGDVLAHVHVTQSAHHEVHLRHQGKAQVQHSCWQFQQPDHICCI